ncbi:MAG TPA: hypothetical protein V6D23_08700 [Candidatus Obscuribacterales bacterium]
MRYGILMPMLILAALLPGPAGWSRPEAVVSCQTAAYVNDPDPRGLNVRSGPGKNFGVLVVLPTRQAEPAVKVNVDISGYSAGWLRLAQAWDLNRKPLLRRPGWVHASLLATSTRTGPNQRVSLFLQPDGKGLAARIPDLSEDSLISCRGTWLEVSQGKTHGWLRQTDQCPLSETTCP